MPVVFQARFKVLVLAYKALCDLSPECLKGSLVLQIASQPFGSSGEDLL